MKPLSQRARAQGQEKRLRKRNRILLSVGLAGTLLFATAASATGASATTPSLRTDAPIRALADAKPTSNASSGGPQAPDAKAAAITNWDGTCHVDDFCTYYNSSSHGYGSMHDWWYVDQKELYNNRFLSKGAGKGQRVRNNSAYVYNGSNLCVFVYTGRNYTGKIGVIQPFSEGNLSRDFKNNIESFDMASCGIWV